MPTNQKNNLKTSEATQYGTSQTQSFQGNHAGYSQAFRRNQNASPNGPLAGSSKPSSSEAQSNKKKAANFRETKKNLGGSAIQAPTTPATLRQSLATTVKEQSVRTPIFDETMRQIEAQEQAHEKRERARSWRARRESRRQTARTRRQQGIDSASQSVENPRGDLAPVLNTKPTDAHGKVPVETTPPNTETGFAFVENTPGPSFDASMSGTVRNNSGGISNAFEEKTNATVEPIATETVQITVPTNEKCLQERKDLRPDGFWRAIFMAFIAGLWFYGTIAMSLGGLVLIFGATMLNGLVKTASPYLWTGLTAVCRCMKDAFSGSSSQSNTPAGPSQSKLTLYEFKKCKLADRYMEGEYPGFKKAIRRSADFSEAEIDLLLLNTKGDTRIDREGTADFCARLEDIRWAVNYCADAEEFLLLLRKCIVLHDEFDAWQGSKGVSR